MSESSFAGRMRRHSNVEESGHRSEVGGAKLKEKGNVVLAHLAGGERDVAQPALSVGVLFFGGGVVG